MSRNEGLTEMQFVATNLEGAWIIEPERHHDDRGFFARTWCRDEFSKRGLNDRLVQCNVSFNRSRGTLRGMHFQLAPHAEAKLVRCTAGSIFDAIVDLRPQSATYLQHLCVHLDSNERNALFIPEGFAHGFQTLEDNTEVLYQMSMEFHPESTGGIRWNDPAVGIEWPLPVTMISDKDATYPSFLPERVFV